MKIWCFDCFSGLRHNDSWGREVWKAAAARGHEPLMFKSPEEVKSDGYLFARRRQFPPLYDQDAWMLNVIAKPGIKPIQDWLQWDLYEDKIAQFGVFGKIMPRTFLTYCKEEARSYLYRPGMEYPLISKSTVGSASVNVRVIASRDEALKEVDAVFGPGLDINSGRKQQGYVLWQEFIPHDTTWRVTAVGTKRHVYKRFCYPDRPVAAPSAVVQTEPVPMSEEVESLLEFSNEVFDFGRTKWCAIDVLKNQSGDWRLLETSLAWARGNDPAGNAKFYDTNFSLNTQHELLVREIDDGVFA